MSNIPIQELPSKTSHPKKTPKCYRKEDAAEERCCRICCPRKMLSKNITIKETISPQKSTISGNLQQSIQPQLPHQTPHQGRCNQKEHAGCCQQEKEEPQREDGVFVLDLWSCENLVCCGGGGFEILEFVWIGGGFGGCWSLCWCFCCCLYWCWYCC